MSCGAFMSDSANIPNPQHAMSGKVEASIMVNLVGSLKRCPPLHLRCRGDSADLASAQMAPEPRAKPRKEPTWQEQPLWRFFSQASLLLTGSYWILLELQISFCEHRLSPYAAARYRPRAGLDREACHGASGPSAYLSRLTVSPNKHCPCCAKA